MDRRLQYHRHRNNARSRNQELLAAKPERQQITAIKLSVSRIGGSQIIRPFVLSIQLKNLPKAKMGQRLQELLPQFGKIWE